MVCSVQRRWTWIDDPISRTVQQCSKNIPGKYQYPVIGKVNVRLDGIKSNTGLFFLLSLYV
ncbi:MAG TPA: hypothetical protein VIP70_02850 [Nitrososphaeraceae archaeon]